MLILPDQYLTSQILSLVLSFQTLVFKPRRITGKLVTNKNRIGLLRTSFKKHPAIYDRNILALFVDDNGIQINFGDIRHRCQKL